MRLIMVRHGEPDYEKDCLTAEGRLQAQAVAVRLMGEGISALYASPLGRARETAAYTAEALRLPVTVLDYMREITWGGRDIPDGGHPWILSDRLIAEQNYTSTLRNWRRHPYFRSNAVKKNYDLICEQIDLFMQDQGYRHEGRRFRCEHDAGQTIALFSHGGSGACVLSHLLSLPFPYVLSVMTYHFTSVIILEFPDTPGEYVFPKLLLFNDTSHLRGQYYQA